MVKLGSKFARHADAIYPAVPGPSGHLYSGESSFAKEPLKSGWIQCLERPKKQILPMLLRRRFDVGPIVGRSARLVCSVVAPAPAPSLRRRS